MLSHRQNIGGQPVQKLLNTDGSIWSYVKPAAGLVALGVLAVVGVSLILGLVGAVISFMAWVALRLLPIAAVAALLYWLARETGWLDRARR